jgi:hydroxymethylglutaryl-CoA lyase
MEQDVKFPKKVRIREVSPRDGLQAEPKVLPTSIKLELIKGLLDAGAAHIEVASFVSPKWLPQMADAEEILRNLPRHSDVTYSVLAPNIMGLERALALSPQEITVFVSATETHNMKNLNRPIASTLQEIKLIAGRAYSENIKVSAVIVVAFGCPYEGGVSWESLQRLIEYFGSVGIEQITLGDTIGVANPRQVYRVVRNIIGEYPWVNLGLHFHDTRGVALSNALFALMAGADYFDTALGGIGGSPFSPGAGGNLATEDLVYCLHAMDIDTGFDLSKLIALGDRLQKWVGHELPSRVHKSFSESFIN